MCPQLLFLQEQSEWEFPFAGTPHAATVHALRLLSASNRLRELQNTLPSGSLPAAVVSTLAISTRSAGTIGMFFLCRPSPHLQFSRRSPSQCLQLPLWTPKQLNRYWVHLGFVPHWRHLALVPHKKMPCDVVIPNRSPSKQETRKYGPKTGEQKRLPGGSAKTGYTYNPDNHAPVILLYAPGVCKTWCFCAGGLCPGTSSVAPVVLAFLFFKPTVRRYREVAAGRFFRYLRYCLDTPCWHSTPQHSMAFRLQRHSSRINSGTRRSP